jgi:hypothetical protein
MSLRMVLCCYYVCEEKQYLCTAATNGSIVHPQVIYEYGQSRWNDSDRGKPKNSEENLS